MLIYFNYTKREARTFIKNALLQSYGFGPASVVVDGLGGLRSFASSCPFNMPEGKHLDPNLRSDTL